MNIFNYNRNMNEEFVEGGSNKYTSYNLQSLYDIL